MMGKRSGLQNFWASFDDKRSLSLKPNGKAVVLQDYYSTVAS